MNAYISTKGVLAGIAFFALVSATIYFVNPESSELPSHPHSALSGTATESTVKSTTPPLKSSMHEVQAINTQVTTTIDAQSDSDTAFAMLERSNQIPLTARDLALLPPSGTNVMTEATGEYADQINLPVGSHNEIAESDLPSEVASNSHPPGGKNVTSEPRGENSGEVNQQALIEKAKYAGYLPPEVAPDSHPPSDKNVTLEPQGENAQQVSQQALIDKAKAEGYLPP